MGSILQCMDCGQQYPINQLIYTCDNCGGLLDVRHDLTSIKQRISRDLFDARLGATPSKSPYHSGVWRYKELVYPDLDEKLIVTRPEGNTNLYRFQGLQEWAGSECLYLKHEGENPTGSFKDRGMTGGVTQARSLGMKQIACASTGNTSAALASYAAQAGLRGIVFFQNSNVAIGKLAQAVAYGAMCVRVEADFDRNLELVRELSMELGIYVLNSVNPFRLEGQKTIMFETIQQLDWNVPDWIVVPGGNLGNSSSFGKALCELYELGLIDKLPRLAVIQAEGASPLYRAYQNGFTQFESMKAHTVASAIKIGNPVNYAKAVRALRDTNGVVEMVTDQEIMDAKAIIDASGIGCEPASACSLAGTRKLIEAGIIHPSETVVGILTGHVLKDPDAVVNYHSNTMEDVVASHPNLLHDVGDNVQQIRTLLQSNLA